MTHRTKHAALAATMSPDEVKIRDTYSKRKFHASYNQPYKIPVYKETSLVSISDVSEPNDDVVEVVQIYTRDNQCVVKSKYHHWKEIYGELNNTRVLLVMVDCDLPNDIRLKYSPPLAGTIK